jgi:hypothetical protein
MAVALCDFVDAHRLRIRGFAAEDGIFEGKGDILAQLLWVVALALGQLREVGVGLGEVVDTLGGFDVLLVQVVDEC